MTHRPVGAGSSFTFAAGTASTSTAFSVQSDTLRIIAVGASAHVAIGASPTAATTDYYIPSGTAVTLAMTKASNRIVGVTTGTTTIVTLPEGTFSDFSAGDIVELTGVVPSGINTTAATVASVNASNSAGTGGFNRVITLTWNTSTQGAPITTSTGVLRRTTKVAAFGASGKLHITEIQIAGG